MEKVLQKWLDHQCRMLQGSRRALLVTGKPRNGKFKRAFFWPDDNYDHAVFFRVAQVAVRNKKTVIKTLRNLGKNSDQSLNVLACPIFFKKKLLGAVVIAMAYRSLSLQNAAVHAKSKLFGLRRPSLQTVAGLTIIFLVGLLLISPLLRIPSSSETASVTRRAIMAPQPIKATQKQPAVVVRHSREEAVSKTRKQIRLPKDAQQDAEPGRQGTGSQPDQVAARSNVVQDKSDAIRSPAVSEEVSSASSETDTTPSQSEVVATTYSIEIGPIIQASHLKQATHILQTNGLEFQQTTGEGTVKAIRLLEGLYPRTEVNSRFKAVQKLVASPFVLREKGGMAIYVATYHDRIKAEQKIKQLAKNGIHVTAVDAELKKKGTLLSIQNCTQSHMDMITDRMSHIGLPVSVAASE